MSGVRIDANSALNAKFSKGDIVHVSTVINGQRAKQILGIRAIRFNYVKGCVEYQLEEISTNLLFQNGVWVREKDLKLERAVSVSNRIPSQGSGWEPRDSEPEERKLRAKGDSNKSPEFESELTLENKKRKLEQLWELEDREELSAGTGFYDASYKGPKEEGSQKSNETQIENEWWSRMDPTTYPTPLIERLQPNSASDYNRDDLSDWSYWLTPPSVFDFGAMDTALKPREHNPTLMMDVPGDVMETVRRSVRRTTSNSDVPSPFNFTIECDIKGYIRKKYGETLKDLRHMIAITGDAQNAQLTTVGQYFAQTWHSSPDELLDVLNSFLAQQSGFEEKFQLFTYRNATIFRTKCIISVDQEAKSVQLEMYGPPTSICVICQQLAWLGAVCTFPRDGLSYCHVSSKSPFSGIRNSPATGFKYDLTPLGDEIQLCWHRLIGDMVIVQGFPIPPRPEAVKGLQIPLELMAELGKVLLVEHLDSGIVLKGDTGAFDFFPVDRSGEYVQWHLVDSAQSTMAYDDEKHPTRLNLEKLPIEDLAKTVACLGWTKHVVNNSGTNKIRLKIIKPSELSQVSERSFTPTGFQFSISKIVGVSVPFAIAPTQFAPQVQKLELYEENLRDLAERNVVLYDTNTHRGWLLDAERVALQIILHRQQDEVYDKDALLDVATPDCKVRAVMMANLMKKLGKDTDLSSMEEKDVFFALEVRKIREKLVQLALAAQVEFRRISQSVGSRRKVIGFEYIDLVRAPEIAKPLSNTLKSSYGEWTKFAHSQLCATVLFAKDFQEILQPRDVSKICRSYRRVPSHGSYLAAETSLVKKLVETQALSITGTDSLYPTCNNLHDESSQCGCIRVQSMRQGNATSAEILADLDEEHGALIFGQRSHEVRIRTKFACQEPNAVAQLVYSTNNIGLFFDVKGKEPSRKLNEESEGPQDEDRLQNLLPENMNVT